VCRAALRADAAGNTIVIVRCSRLRQAQPHRLLSCRVRLLPQLVSTTTLVRSYGIQCAHWGTPGAQINSAPDGGCAAAAAAS